MLPARILDLLSVYYKRLQSVTFDRSLQFGPIVRSGLFLEHWNDVYNVNKNYSVLTAVVLIQQDTAQQKPAFLKMHSLVFGVAFNAFIQ